MLLRLDNVCLAYGSRPLLDQVSLQLAAGERVCLVGRNGEGKSSLVRVLRGELMPDAGTRWLRPGARIGHLEQDIVATNPLSVAEAVAGGEPLIAQTLARYHALAAEDAHSAAQLRELDQLHQQLDALGGWQMEQRLNLVLSRLRLDPLARVDQLSGGWRRRALLARAWVSEPEVLLLDEPTNHLDIEAIQWLEGALLDYRGALLFVSHDRAFVNAVATRVLELDRGQLYGVSGNYDDFARARAQRLAAETQHAALFDKKLAQEEVWIRKGVEARRTRNEGRVRALYRLREQRRQRRESVGRVELAQSSNRESGELVFEATHVDIDFSARPILKDFSVRIMRGDRIGLVGPNGAGKSTLIKVLLGELVPTHGQVRHGSRLDVAYYDQQREQLKLDESVMENVSGRNDQVVINGQSRHVSGYLRDFLFRPDQLHTPARALSGGERNRLLLARLFAKPANVLVLDEPTNDLDLDTLELLEEFVSDFAGTLLVVSHDRALLDHVVTSLLVFEGDGQVREFVGGYSDWARDRQQRLAAAPVDLPNTEQPSTPLKKSRKLSYKERLEMQSLPTRLETLEAEKQALEIALNEPNFYSAPPAQVRERLERLSALGTELERAYERWAELEALADERSA